MIMQNENSIMIYRSQCFSSSTFSVSTGLSQWTSIFKSRLILGLRPINERRRYKATPSLIGRAQTKTEPCNNKVCVLTGANRTASLIKHLNGTRWETRSCLDIWWPVCYQHGYVAFNPLAGIGLGMRPANERLCYTVTTSLIGRALT